MNCSSWAQKMCCENCVGLSTRKSNNRLFHHYAKFRQTPVVSTNLPQQVLPSRVCKIYLRKVERTSYIMHKEKSDWIKIDWTTCLRNLGKKCHHTDRKRFLTCIYDLENTTSVAVFRHAYEQNTTRSANAENCELFLPHTGVDIFSLTGPASQSSWQ